MYLALSCDINKEYKNDCLKNMRYLIDDAAKILAQFYRKTWSRNKDDFDHMHKLLDSDGDEA